jgi:hypothetical protein
MQKFIFSLLLHCLTAVVCFAEVNGIKDIDHVESAKQRLELYLEKAQGQSASHTIFFRVSEASYFKESDNLQILDTEGVVISDFKTKAFYSSNQETSDKNEYPRRSEMMRYKGKEKGKFYLAKSDEENGRVKEIPPDEDGQRASVEKSGIFGAAHTEIDPFGLPLTTALGAKSRHSDIDIVVGNWTTKCKLVGERTEKGFLRSDWVTKNGKNAMQLTFDNASGGMPVEAVFFTVDKDGRRTPEHFSQTRTSWSKTEEHWYPKRIVSNSKNFGVERDFSVDIEILTTSQHKELIEKIQWEELFNGNRSDWFGSISKRVVELAPSKKK